ncbi:MAG: hypothetical protein VR64_16755 [Desulfatitalea sp. BRH_c12]|nr:MAG: hypothetical protein VR64_16755 [Desulfatitalea sp. BRH_c12]
MPDNSDEHTAVIGERLRQVQVYISRMPSLSTTVAKVLEVCNKPTASPSDLNRVISLDPVLTGQVLKLVNSAYYSLPGRVTSLTRAIIMLGVNTVKNLVLATSVLASFTTISATSRFSIDAYWAHCLYVGTAAKAIAKLKKVPVMEQEEYFVAGLLHDLGKLPMIACFGELYSQAIRLCGDDYVALFQAEKKMIGFDHCQVGALISARWKLNTIQHAIVHHHRPLADGCHPDNVLYFTSLANQMAPYFQFGTACDRHTDEMLIQKLAKRIGVGTGAILKLKPDIEQEIEKAWVFLNNSAKR